MKLSICFENYESKFVKNIHIINFKLGKTQKIEIEFPQFPDLIIQK